jgi:hypothetical protein
MFDLQQLNMMFQLKHRQHHLHPQNKLVNLDIQNRHRHHHQQLDN